MKTTVPSVLSLFLLASCLTLLTSCTAREAIFLEDLIEGEAEVAEKIVEDESGQKRPQVEIVKH